MTSPFQSSLPCRHGTTPATSVISTCAFHQALNRVVIPKLLGRLKQDDRFDSRTQKILPSDCSEESQTKQVSFKHSLITNLQEEIINTIALKIIIFYLPLPPVAPNSLIAQRDASFSNLNGFGRFDPRRGAGRYGRGCRGLNNIVDINELVAGRDGLGPVYNTPRRE
ncbi:hypothetical protein FGADI_12601, partial [Fusarium gaditjirri]